MRKDERLYKSGIKTIECTIIRGLPSWQPTQVSYLINKNIISTIFLFKTMLTLGQVITGCITIYTCVIKVISLSRKMASDSKNFIKGIIYKCSIQQVAKYCRCAYSHNTKSQVLVPQSRVTFHR